MQGGNNLNMKGKTEKIVEKGGQVGISGQSIEEIYFRPLS